MPYTVRQQGPQWAVMSDKGTVIGRHLKKSDAIQQKIAVELQEGIGQRG
jgi:hypothetical protein